MALLLNANDSVSRSYSITKPSPLHPIVPSECGERTGNLFDDNATDTENGYITGRFLKSDNTTSSNSVYNVSEYIELHPEQTYTISRYANSASTPGICFYDANKDYISGLSYSGQNVLSFTTPTNTKYIRMSVRSGLRPTLNEGSTAPTSYIPYGYKLPLTSAGQNVDIYLGESQTTRQIKKLVLTGEENVTYLSVSGLSRFAISLYTTSDFRIGSCSHYNYEYKNADGNIYHESAAGGLLCFIFDHDYSSSADFKSYLAQQYANGTPVTIWYVLSTPTTGILNEPLRKIGNYADTIDSTQTSAQIPTTAGSTTISWAGSGLAPSEFDSIQEWVDIPTYTYTNGEWVADNSN